MTNTTVTAAKIQSVSFHSQLITALDFDSKPFIAMRPICENIGLDWEAQRQRIKRNHILNKGACMIKAPTNSGMQEFLCLPLGYLNGWLFGIDINRVKPEIKDKLIQYQEECFEVLFNHFSNNVENSQQLISDHEYRQETRKSALAFSDACMEQLIKNKLPIPEFPKVNDSILDGIATTVLMHARFMVTFDHEFKMQLRQLPMNATVICEDNKKQMIELIRERIPLEFIPDLMQIGLQRISNRMNQGGFANE